MNINIGNCLFDILDPLYHLLEYHDQRKVTEAFFSNNFDINNPIQYCVINYILKPTEKR